jgi:hypothetical protein
MDEDEMNAEFMWIMCKADCWLANRKAVDSGIAMQDEMFFGRVVSNRLIVYGRTGKNPYTHVYELSETAP